MQQLFAFTVLCVDGLLSVAHVFDDGISILKPMRITDTHVIVNVSHLSAFGLIWNFVKKSFKIPEAGQVLLFLRFKDTVPLKINVFLLHERIHLSEVSIEHSGGLTLQISDASSRGQTPWALFIG